MDDKTTIIAEIKKKIGDAEIEEAIQQLLGYLERDRSYLDLHSDALQALSQYRKAKREAAQGIISYDQAKLSYNQVTNQVLNILETLQREEETGRPVRRRWPVLAGALILVLVVGGSIFWILKKNGSPGEAEIITCPDFGTAEAFGILLFPYYDTGASDKLDTDIPALMRSRFEDFGRNYNLRISPRPIELSPRITNNPNRFFPLSVPRAESIGKRCRARLVIWGFKTAGTAEKSELTTRYKFLFPEGFNMAQLSVTEDTEVREVSSPSRIAIDGILTGEIEASIISWFSGIIAHESGNFEAAISSLKGLVVPSDSAGLVRDMMLADSYMKLNDLDNAVRAYDQVLKQHPKYWLGWHNRGVLYFKKGDYQKSIEDLNQRLELKSTDVESRIARGEAYLKLEQLQKARDDFQSAKNLAAKDTSAKTRQLRPLIERRLKTVDRAIDTQRTIKRDAEQRLQENSNDTRARTALIQAELKLGNDREAVAASLELLQQQPDRKVAMERLVALYQKNNQPNIMDTLLKTATERGLIDKQKALDISRSLKTIPLVPEKEN